MKRVLFVLAILLSFGIANAAVAERTANICESLNLTNKTNTITISSNFETPEQAKQILVSSLNLSDTFVIPEYYKQQCTDYTYGYSCAWPQLGILIFSESYISIDCNHQGPTDQEALAIAEQEKEDYLTRLGISLTGLLVVVFASWILVKKYVKGNFKENNHTMQKVKDWFNYYKEKGYAPKQLIESLRSSGYKKEDIKKITK